MKTLEESLKERLKNPEFKKEWELLEAESSLSHQSLESKIYNIYFDSRVGESRPKSSFSISY